MNIIALAFVALEGIGTKVVGFYSIPPFLSQSVPELMIALKASFYPIDNLPAQRQVRKSLRLIEAAQANLEPLA
jgi:hypothetical protein